eukprot:scaffold13674_cov109-Isochrysis_galbana.AAC.2
MTKVLVAGQAYSPPQSPCATSIPCAVASACRQSGHWQCGRTADIGPTAAWQWSSRCTTSSRWPCHPQTSRAARAPTRPVTGAPVTPAPLSPSPDRASSHAPWSRLPCSWHTSLHSPQLPARMHAHRSFQPLPH